MVKTRSRPITSIFHKKGKDNASDENGIPVTKSLKVVEKVKRSAEASPENAPSRKRSAFGDITNATFNQQGDKDGKKPQAKNNVVRKESTRKQAKTTVKAKPKANKRKSSGSTFQQAPACSTLDSSSSSGEIPSSQDSIEVSASQESSHSSSSSSRSEVEFNGARPETGTDSALSSLEDSASVELDITKRDDNEIEQQQAKKQVENAVPSDVIDIDNDKSDPFTVANYAFEIFQNMKQREELFPLTAFMEAQPDITPNMRAILVDWLVEVQECFELYHETLYLAVKLLDHFLEKNTIKREELQLVGATTLIIASKIEERHPPCMDDFIYICDDAYQQPQFIAMEGKIILSLGFDINIPIPYRFLRRYAKAAFANIETLTLARFILESSLLESKFIPNKASFMAASCLYLALLMKGNGEWTPTLVHHTGYTKDQLRDCVLKLNSMNAAPPNKNLMTVRSKYSHKVFHEVAKIPALDTLTIEV